MSQQSGLVLPRHIRDCSYEKVSSLQKDKHEGGVSQGVNVGGGRNDCWGPESAGLTRGQLQSGQYSGYAGCLDFCDLPKFACTICLFHTNG